MLSLTLDIKRKHQGKDLGGISCKNEAPGPLAIEHSEISVFDGTLNGWHQSCMFEALSGSCHEIWKL